VSWCFRLTRKGVGYSPASFLFLEGHKDLYLESLEKKICISLFEAEGEQIIRGFAATAGMLFHSSSNRVLPSQPSAKCSGLQISEGPADPQGVGAGARGEGSRLRGVGAAAGQEAQAPLKRVAGSRG